MYPSQLLTCRLNTQSGFLLPLALFIVVAMGVLALAISRTATQAQSSSVMELLNVQAFYAAESGAQRAMQTLFFPDASSRQAVDGRCASLIVIHSFTGINGLNLCSAQVSCSCRYANNTVCAPATLSNYSPTAALDLTKSFYTVTSIGSCGQNEYRALRTIEAGAFLEQN